MIRARRLRLGWLAGMALGVSGLAQGQAVVMPPQANGPQARASDHVSGFLEDPFVTEYRRKFFSVFAGKTDEFEQGMRELSAMLAKNPNDARALVWHGNGLMVRAGLLKFHGKPEEGRALLVESKQELDRAVALDPDNVNILAMRAVTLYIAGKYWMDADLPKGSWQAVIADLEKSRRILGPERMKKLSIHARGEILSELATAYTRTAQPGKARELWQEVEQAVPGSSYAEKAEVARKALDSASAKP